jgi:hypothetical protein
MTHSPYLDKKILYGETTQEIEFEFEPGNEAHLFTKAMSSDSGASQLVISDEGAPRVRR